MPEMPVMMNLLVASPKPPSSAATIGNGDQRDQRREQVEHDHGEQHQNRERAE